MKNREVLLDVIGDADEKLIPELFSQKKKSRTMRRALIGCGTCAALIAGVILLPDGVFPKTTEKSNAMVLAAPVYPEMPAYPEASDDASDYDAWFEARRALRNQPEGYQDGFDFFFANSSRAILADAGGENKVYSPLSLFMALGMSAEISGGNTRQQILDALAQDDMETLRSHAKSIWQANYMDDGMAKCVLANSLWTNNKVSYIQNTAETLADNYYASVYSGNPASDDYNKLMQDWLDGQTDGLLEDYASGISMNPEMVLTLASTVNYNGKWRPTFSRELTEPGTFHSPTEDVPCDFMHAERDTTYFWGDNFSSISIALENNGQMRLLLPNEGVMPEELLRDDEAMAFMTHHTSEPYQNSKVLTVNMSIPKFDVSSSTDLKSALEKLGISDLFDPAHSDFSPLTKQADGIYVDRVEQDARVLIDEEGCKASALTLMLLLGAGIPQDCDYVYFTLDRPFLFEILSVDGLPLFIGIVNNPTP